MVVTEKDIAVIKAVCSFYVVTRSQVHRCCFPTHRDGRATRKRLGRLVHAGYIAKMPTPVAFPTGNSGPAYYPTQKGLELLYSYFDDEKYLAVNTQQPRKDLLFHWLMISEIHLIVEQAVAAEDAVTLDVWFNEWQTLPNTDSQGKRYYLHMVLRKLPLLSCSPDAGFLLSILGHHKAFYVEADRGTSGVRQVAARKAPGYAEVARRKLHRRHFPQTTMDDFAVLLITTDARRRDRLAQEIAKKESPELWLFADRADVKPETFLYDETVWFNHAGEAGPLIQEPEPPSDG